MPTDFIDTIPSPWPLTPAAGQQPVPWPAQTELDAAAERCRAELAAINARQRCHADQRNLLARAFGVARSKRFDDLATAPGALS